MLCWLLADLSTHFGFNHSYLNGKPLKMPETNNYHKHVCTLFIPFPETPTGIIRHPDLCFLWLPPHKPMFLPLFLKASHIHTGPKPRFFSVHCISWHRIRRLGLIVKSHLHFKAHSSLTYDTELTAHGEMCLALTVLTGTNTNRGE